MATQLRVNQIIGQMLGQGMMLNGKITTSVTSNNLTVAIKTLAGADPSSSDPVYVRIGNSIRTISAAFAFVRTGTLAAQGPTINVVSTAELSVNDYIEVQAWQDSGGALAVTGAASDSYFQTHFEAIKIGDIS